MLRNSLFLALLQGITLFLISTCKGQIDIEPTDDKNVNIKVNVTSISKYLLEQYISSNDGNGVDLKLNTSDEFQNRLRQYLGGTNDTQLKLNLNLDDLRETIPKIQQVLRDGEHYNNMTFEEAILDIDEKLKRRSRSPCIDFEPAKPHFQYSHRISEAKCLDYIWDIKLEEERVKRSELCRGQNDPVEPFIISGKTVNRGDYPHMGAVGWAAKKDKWIFLCGSSLISHKFVLTAAHCHSVSEDDERVTYNKPKIVRFGVVNIVPRHGTVILVKVDSNRDGRDATNRHPVDIEIRRFISHPKYNYTVKYYDIALMELGCNSDYVRFTRNIRPACLWNKYELNNVRTASVTGWGVTNHAVNREVTSLAMLVANIDVIERHECGNKLRLKEQREWWGLKPHQLCAGKRNGTGGACQGDSGGPLQVKLTTNTKKPIHSIIGVTSFGFGCGSIFPSIYTRVSTSLDWIETEIWGSKYISDTPHPYSGSHRGHRKHFWDHSTEKPHRRRGNYRSRDYSRRRD